MNRRATGITRVPFVDLGRVNHPLADEVRAAHERIIERGDFILGTDVARFEEDFAAYIGAGRGDRRRLRHSRAQIGLRAAGIGPGDEVIVPAHTFIASTLAVSTRGQRPSSATSRRTPD